MTDKKTLEVLLHKYEKQEQLLQFEHFSNVDALELGIKLIEQAKKLGVTPVFDITINGYKVFRYGFEGTNQHNDMWLKRKANTVNTLHMSSIRAGALLEYREKKIDVDWLLSPYDYTCSGGGFPVRIKGTGVIGSVCCSGLPQEKDHQLIVDTLCDYLSINPNDLEL